MRDLDKNKIYSLEDLTSKQKQQLLEKLIELDSTWEGASPKEELFTSNFLYFSDYYRVVGEWLVSQEKLYTSKETRNAKELFYTLENIQVDCRELSEEQIKKMADVFESNGYINSIGFNVCDTYFLLRQRWNKEDRNFGVLGEYKDDRFITITYEKFMELFSNKEENFKKLVEVLNEELTEKAYKETSNKLYYELDFNFITQLAERMNANKGKYEPYNWQKLDNIEDLKQALFRHVMEVMKCNYEDDNRSFGHLEAIALNCMFINYQLNNGNENL